MNRRLIVYSAFFTLLIGIFGCKSAFETIRSSGDTALIQKKAFEYFEKEDYLKAQMLFELILNSVKGKTDSEKIYFYYAQTHFHLNNYILGAYYFKTFANTFPK